MEIRFCLFYLLPPFICFVLNTINMNALIKKSYFKMFILLLLSRIQLSTLPVYFFLAINWK